MSSLLKSITLLLAITSFGNSSEIYTSMSNAINGIEINAINSKDKENKLTLNLNAHEYIPIHLRNESNNNVISNKYHPIYRNPKTKFNLREQKIECLQNVINNWGNKEIVIYNLNKFINIVYKCEIYISRNMLEKWGKTPTKYYQKLKKSN